MKLAARRHRAQVAGAPRLAARWVCWRSSASTSTSSTWLQNFSAIRWAVARHAAVAHPRIEHRHRLLGPDLDRPLGLLRHRRLHDDDPDRRSRLAVPGDAARRRRARLPRRRSDRRSGAADTRAVPVVDHAGSGARRFRRSSSPTTSSASTSPASQEAATARSSAVVM